MLYVMRSLLCIFCIEYIWQYYFCFGIHTKPSLLISISEEQAPAG